ncbi:MULTISPECIES: acetyl-CoA C-acetyltransferase [unclassified Modestobacter]|uniref:acetyl-CoA C-acetyltransferase n=1 Tax=unclassified Modestobacter TaxID=2643866 RepID=UPI0022AA1194|nr:MULTISPECIES: acetyl-CoA C-acetyltransferase [unclassified Modestobacter]MCZ2823983.1 acetyl-CoA C-acetyltransferase [Modestobacter sp. VKM Ac-2981]MCZ2852228.1 acetyl-CoA C-acetyltransferase [Modestobacter sp. VKM Ac-2982]
MSQPASTRSVIVGGARTPMGRLLGSLKDFSAADLGGVAIKAALERAGITGDQVDYVIMGHVIQAGAGQNPARPAAVAGGIPMSVPSFTLNKVCLSGLDAIALADQLIRAGEFEVVVAGGMESMTQAPHLLPTSRTGTKYGDATLVDAMAHDGLTDTFDQVAMGALTEQANSRYGLTREEQDAFAAASHQKAAAAQKNGLFDDEITPVLIPQRKGDPIEFREDEGIRPDTTAESLGRLKPAFSKDGTITAATSSQISDGACAVVVMSAAKAAELGLTVLAEIGAHGVVAGPDATLQSQPARAIAKACAREGIDPADLDLVELNEAFAAVGIVSTRELAVDEEKVNPNGGAIALGHPVGMSGARIVLHLVLELGRRGGGVGAAALCGGGGQGDALVLHVPARA